MYLDTKWYSFLILYLTLLLYGIIVIPAKSIIIIFANMSLNGMSITFAVTFATSDMFIDFYSNDDIWKYLTLNSIISKTQRGILFRFSRFAYLLT